MWQLLNRNEYTTRGQNKVYCVFIYMHFSIFDKSLIKTKTKLERLLCWLMKTNADAVYFSTNWIFCLFYTIFENHSSQSLFFQHCERSELFYCQIMYIITEYMDLLFSNHFWLKILKLWIFAHKIKIHIFVTG